MVPEEMIRLGAPKGRGQFQLVRYDFSNEQSGTLRHVGIYTKEKKSLNPVQAIDQLDANEAIENVLKPSGLWQDSYGEKIYASIDRGCGAKIPKTL